MKFRLRNEGQVFATESDSCGINQQKKKKRFVTGEFALGFSIHEIFHRFQFSDQSCIISRDFGNSRSLGYVQLFQQLKYEFLRNRCRLRGSRIQVRITRAFLAIIISSFTMFFLLACRLFRKKWHQTSSTEWVSWGSALLSLAASLILLFTTVSLIESLVKASLY